MYILIYFNLEHVTLLFYTLSTIKWGKNVLPHPEFYEIKTASASLIFKVVMGNIHSRENSLNSLLYILFSKKCK